MTTSGRVSESRRGARSACAVSARCAGAARAPTSSHSEAESRTFALRGSGPVARGAIGRLSHDDQLQQDVCAALLRTPGLDASRIVVGAFEHGWVTLLGRVSTRRQRQLAVQVARRSVGGSAVRCLLETGEGGWAKAEHAAGRQLAETDSGSCPPGGKGGSLDLSEGFCPRTCRHGRARRPRGAYTRLRQWRRHRARAARARLTCARARCRARRRAREQFRGPPARRRVAARG
jgi:hypothetical protein